MNTSNMIFLILNTIKGIRSFVLCAVFCVIAFDISTSQAETKKNLKGLQLVAEALGKYNSTPKRTRSAPDQNTQNFWGKNVSGVIKVSESIFFDFDETSAQISGTDQSELQMSQIERKSINPCRQENAAKWICQIARRKVELMAIDKSPIGKQNLTAKIKSDGVYFQYTITGRAAK